MSYNDELADIFYAKGIFMRNLNNFMNAVRKADLDIPAEDVKKFYDNQTIVQVFKKRPIQLNPKLHSVSIPQTKPFERIYGDTMYFTDKRTKNKFGLICFVDGFTRYGYAFYVPLKTAVQKADINDAVNALYEYLDLLEDRFDSKPKIFITDDGNEFAEPFVEELREEEIGHRYGIAGDTLKNPIAERFNYTIRLMIEKFRTTYDQNDQQDNKKDPSTINTTKRMINTILKKYNDLPTKATGGLSPNDAIKNPNLVKQYYTNRDEKQIKSRRVLFPAGTWVRISLKKIGEAFGSTLRQNWTTKVYQVQRYDKRRNRYVVNNNTYLAEELLPVDKQLLDEYDMFRKIVKNPKQFESNLQLARKERTFPKTREGRVRELSILKIADFERLAVAMFGASKRNENKSTITEGGRPEKARRFIFLLEKRKRPELVREFFDLTLKQFIDKYAPEKEEKPKEKKKK